MAQSEYTLRQEIYFIQYLKNISAICANVRFVCYCKLAQNKQVEGH